MTAVAVRLVCPDHAPDYCLVTLWGVEIERYEYEHEALALAKRLEGARCPGCAWEAKMTPAKPGPMPHKWRPYSPGHSSLPVHAGDQCEHCGTRDADLEADDPCPGALVEALWRYARHADACDIPLRRGQDCTCGLARWLEICAELRERYK